ncbi:hypothetical protein [Morganella sp. GD04133]|uniref:hypothetical protein n=1 Tax=Morganella sp. GD04133 TaxID=2975435 RepID=UPI00244C9D8C|nr:hypothetical protein [Morganella sp. GD04133]MDH0354036.1 hypothetical protein [Morganella sp. GD04133]
MRYTIRNFSNQQVIHALISKSKTHHSDSHWYCHETASAGQDGNRESNGNNGHSARE